MTQGAGPATSNPTLKAPDPPDGEVQGGGHVSIGQMAAERSFHQARAISSSFNVKVSIEGDLFTEQLPADIFM